MSTASTEDKLRKVHTLLRSWGYTVKEVEGAWGRAKRSNGAPGVWTAGEPVGLLNHHFVTPLSKAPDANIGNMAYGDSVLAGPKGNWYVHMDSIYFIASGPANHAGAGDNNVLRRALDDKRYDGNTGKDNYSGNNLLLGQESHHPGDLTPWPADLVDKIVALNAACTIVFDWPLDGARSLNHKWHTRRKIDMSNSFPGNIQEMTEAFILKKLSAVPTPTEEEEMADLIFCIDTEGTVYATRDFITKCYVGPGEGAVKEKIWLEKVAGRTAKLWTNQQGSELVDFIDINQLNTAAKVTAGADTFGATVGYDPISDVEGEIRT